jgi:hypothetical protein
MGVARLREVECIQILRMLTNLGLNLENKLFTLEFIFNYIYSFNII